MRKILLIAISIAFLGCAYEGQNVGEYIKDPSNLVKDPHFAEYKKERDELENQYLYQKVTYADYKEKVDALDQKYNKEVEERNAKMMSNP